MTTATYTGSEKRYNEIALRWLFGTAPDTTATADLRLIAQTCLADGGRAVLSARGLCEAWLKEYYSEDSCQGIPQGRSASARPETETAASPGLLLVVPNPATDAVRILPGKALAQEDRTVQVVSMNGQQVYTGVLPAGASELTVPVNGWPEGMYIVRILDGDKTLSRTFVVQRR